MNNPPRLFLELKLIYSRITKRNIFAHENDKNEVEFDGRPAFRNKVYLIIINSLKSNLSGRKTAYEVLSVRFEVVTSGVAVEGVIK